ncbi:trypsin-like serine protease [Corynebacterium sp. S5S1]|uniref:trypsin-like serine protease n=1 Tax=Corynebacterium sp. S5S1 TaxID=1881620 RepID=UPI00257FC0AD|nr:trypsin-like serine protease [Corynebacterium sp. S5S1]
MPFPASGFGNHTTAHLLHTGVEKTGVDGTEEAYHAPTGDIALVRMSTHSAFKFDSYPELATEAPKPGQVGTFYGWDSTAHKRLPHSQAEVKNLYQNGSYNNGKMYTVHHKDGAYAQPGDSGGPLFIDGKLSGVASAMAPPQSWYVPGLKRPARKLDQADYGAQWR